MAFDMNEVLVEAKILVVEKKHVSAIKKLRKVIDEAEIAHDFGTQADAMRMAADAYAKSGNLEEAKNLLNDAVEIHSKIGCVPGQLGTLVALSGLAIRDQSFGSAKKLVAEACSIAKKNKMKKELKTLEALQKKVGNLEKYSMLPYYMGSAMKDGEKIEHEEKLAKMCEDWSGLNEK